MLTDFHAIYPEPRPVIRRADVQEYALARFWCEGEVPLIPKRTFVEEKASFCVFHSPGTLSIGDFAKFYSTTRASPTLPCSLRNHPFFFSSW